MIYKLLLITAIFSINLFHQFYGFNPITDNSISNEFIEIDNDSFIQVNQTDLLEYIYKKRTLSKHKCYEQFNFTVFIKKLAMFSPIDSFYLKESSGYGISYSEHKKVDKKLLKNSLYRFKYLNSETYFDCYNLISLFELLKNSEINRKEIDSLTSDYIFIYLSKTNGHLVKGENKNLNALKDEYNCHKQITINKVYPFYDEGFIMAYSRNVNKKHLLLGEEFCQSVNDWRTLYSELTSNLTNDSNHKMKILKFYMQLRITEYFSAANINAELEDFIFNKSMRAASAKINKVIFKHTIRGKLPLRDFLVKLDLNNGDVIFESLN